MRQPRKSKPKLQVSDGQSDGEAAFANYLHTLGSNLPEPQREYLFHPDRGWRFDFAWPDKMVAVEINGGQFVQNGGRHNTDEDRTKVAEAQARGWTVFQVSPQQIINAPFEVIGWVSIALIGEKGWT